MSDPGALTYDRTIEALTAVTDRCARDADRTGYFAAMYLAVTHTVRARALAGRFEDAARMERFITMFAARYLAAERAWRAGSPCPEVWRAAFTMARSWRPIILQHLLVGMNAHINLDLGVTTAELATATSLADVRGDFEAVNAVLGEMVDGCQNALGEVSPWLALADRVGDDGDETLIHFSLIAARRYAWSVASRLHPLAGDERERAIATADASATRVARAIEHPGVPASALLLAVRVRERAHPAAVIRLLAAVRPAELAR